MIKSLRWRLQIWHAIVLATVLVIFGSVVYNLHWQTRLQQVDAELDRTAEVLMSRLRRLFPGPPFRGPFRQPPPPARGDEGSGHSERSWPEFIRQELTRTSREERRGPERPPIPIDRPRDEVRRRDARRPDAASKSERDRLAGANGNDPSTAPRHREPISSTRPDIARDERGPRPPWEREPRERGPGEHGPGERGPGERPAAGLGLPEEFQHLFEGEDESRFYFVIFGHEGVVLEKSGLAPDVPHPDLRMEEDGLPARSVRMRDHYREVTHVSRGDINVLVGRSLREDIAAEHRYGALLLLAGCGVLAAGCLGGGWLTAHAIRPISSMTATAQSISAQNLDQRIDLEDTATELGQLANVLNKTFDRLQEAFEQQSRFTADASHELRTPLAVILAHTELALSRRRTPEEYQATLETCQRASTRMKSLIEGLLMLARFDSQQEVLETTEFELGHVIFECIELLQPLAETRQIRIETELESVRIRGDRSRISQVITNLLSNAIRYNHDSGTVKFSVSTASSWTLIRVSDTGVGIPAEELSRIFDRFYRVDKARSRADGGSGLGLSICKTIVEAHQGTIQARNEPQLGTVVEVRLPCGITPEEKSTNR